MSTPPQRRTPLQAVPDPSDDQSAAPARQDAWRTETFIDHYSPEHQFLGSLLWLRAEHARPLLDLVPDNAIWRPQTRWAYELIRRLVATGVHPTPVAVLAAARCQPARDALDPHRPPTEHQQRRLALYLFDAYAQAIAPHAAAGSYAREVLDEAYRRAFATCGARMQHLAATVTDRHVLTEQFSAIRDELADLWRRAEAANPPRGQP